MKHVYKQYLSGGSLLLIATVVVNICNFAFNAYLGRVLTFEQFGIITLINTMWYIALIPINALYTTVNHHIALLTSNNYINESLHFLHGTKKRNLFISLFISVCFVAAIPFIDTFFQIHNYLISFLFTPMKNQNEEEYDDRMLIGYSGYVSYERKIDLFFLLSFFFYGIH